MVLVGFARLGIGPITHKGTAVFATGNTEALAPIEQVFAKLKTLLREAAERSVETVWKSIGSLLDRFPPAACANYLRNAGYAAT